MAAIVDAQIGRDHYHVNITSGSNSVIADEPVDNGGKNEGFSPSQLLLSSLGACTCITVRMYADRKNMNLESIKVNLTLEHDDEKNITNIKRQINLAGNLTTEERERLLAIANKCPVHTILTHPIHIHSVLT